MKNVTYFDVEYANSKNKSICQIGIMCEDYNNGEPAYPEMNLYINPEDGFDDNCIKVHGITNDRVKDEPNFPMIWNKIEKYFTNSVIVGHNVASSDLDALIKMLKRYNLDIPEFYYVCTYDLAKKYVPQFAVENYSLGTLCDFFEIDIDSEHDAFDDACACSDLLKAIVQEYNVDIDECVRKYIPHETNAFSTFITDSCLRKSISEFYGVVRGFSIDNKINKNEFDYIVKWRKENEKYSWQDSINRMIHVIDEITSDGIISSDEITRLQSVIKEYLDTVSTSPITLATQILDGILKGIIVDGEITDDECINLRKWLYDNIYLSDHYPFNKIINLVDDILKDSIITKEELNILNTAIENLLNPVEALKTQAHSVKDKNVCLSGNFAFGSKAQVEEYIIQQGGSIDSSVKKTTNVLVIGNNECQSYSNGTYGTKVKKAIEYNDKGANIIIIKESELFSCEK